MKVLLVARHYPPTVSGGSRRAHTLVTGLRSAGVEVRVAAPQPECGRGDVDYLVYHPNVSPSQGPPARPAVRDHLREWLLFPDPDVRWARRAAKAILQAADWQPDWVITSAPPESIHECGLILQRRLGCKWLADFRDHWLESPLRPVRHYSIRRYIERYWARRYLSAADLVTSVNLRIDEELSRLKPGTACKRKVLPQAADPPPGPMMLPAGFRHVVHTGSFSLSDPCRRIEDVLAVFREALALNQKLVLHLAGRLTDAEQAAIARAGLGEAILHHGILPLVHARELQAAADLGLVLASPGSPAVPGKLFEYAASKTPVLVIGGGRWVDEAGWRAKNAPAVLAGLADGVVLPVPPSAQETGAQLRLWLEEGSTHGIRAR
ncbi:MAG: TPR/glycosyl transferase domain protein [Oceanicaulis sp. HLUCCA04]|nr:MAG: TPR/glycosyl transferase domain protein [Oceanicaulis sp. HLUCCA04]